jgi:trans-aconitate 2-methyltransferase
MAALDPWSPDRYARFAAERRLPFDDLVALLVPAPGGRVVDLGCGPGALTRDLHARLGAAETVGVDASPAMLERAAPLAGGGLRFVLGDAGGLAGAAGEGPWDVVFSNAALHWVEDHEALLPRLAALVAPGGQLAVQVPCNDHHPSHAAARAVAAEPPFAEALGGWARTSPVLQPERYAELLFRLGFAARRVRLEVYGHALASRDEVVEWVRGTTLTEYERRLPPALWPAFLARYRARLAAALPDDRPFLYTFRRLLLWGRLPAPALSTPAG